MADNIAGWPKRTKADNHHYPGEPLYTIEECAVRLGVDPSYFGGMLHWHPGLEPWHRSVGSQRVGKQKHLYRLSDAKRWWSSLNL